jgi:hypothetical protein
MSYQFVVELPQHLEKAYRAGQIVVNSGVARYADTQQIAAHLEQVLPFAGNVAGVTNPYVAMVGPGLRTIRELKGMTVDTLMLKRVIDLTQQVKALSAINVAVSSATLGVSVIGFAVVLHQLNKLDQKVSQMESQLNVIARQQSEIFKNEIGKLIRDARLNIKHCITLIQQIEQLSWSEYLDTEISKQLDRSEVLLNHVIYKYIDRDGINISLELAQQLYNAYADLLKVYLTNRFLHKKDIDYPSLRLKTLCNFSEQLMSEDILDELYEEYLMQREQKLTETELDYILDLYCCGCQNTRDAANNHHEILQKVSVNKFKRWRKTFEASKDPWVWVDHSA